MSKLAEKNDYSIPINKRLLNFDLIRWALVRETEVPT